VWEGRSREACLYPDCAAQPAKLTGPFPAPPLGLDPKSADTSSDAAVSAAVAAVLEFTAVSDAPGLPNRIPASCSCSACWLKFTISPVEALSRADCTEDDDKAEESDADPALDRIWSTSATPGFTELVEPM